MATLSPPALEPAPVAAPASPRAKPSASTGSALASVAPAHPAIHHLPRSSASCSFGLSKRQPAHRHISQRSCRCRQLRSIGSGRSSSKMQSRHRRSVHQRPAASSATPTRAHRAQVRCPAPAASTLPPPKPSEEARKQRAIPGACILFALLLLPCHRRGNLSLGSKRLVKLAIVRTAPPALPRRILVAQALQEPKVRRKPRPRIRQQK